MRRLAPPRDGGKERALTERGARFSEPDSHRGEASEVHLRGRRCASGVIRTRPAVYECIYDGRESIGPCMNRRTRIRSEYAVTNSWRGPGRGDPSPSPATEMRVMQDPGGLFQVTKDHRRSRANDARERGACALAMSVRRRVLVQGSAMERNGNPRNEADDRCLTSERVRPDGRTHREVYATNHDKVKCTGVSEDAQQRTCADSRVDFPANAHDA